MLTVAALTACQSYESPVEKAFRDQNDPTIFQKDWVRINNNCNGLIFKKYFLKDSTVAYDPFAVVWSDTTNDAKRIDGFRSLFGDVKAMGYYCCPCAHYSITFLKDSDILGEYFVDTTVTNGQATVYNGDLQITFDVPLADWNSYLQNK